MGLYAIIVDDVYIASLINNSLLSIRSLYVDMTATLQVFDTFVFTGNPVRTCEHLSEVKMEELYTCVKPLRGECPEVE